MGEYAVGILLCPAAGLESCGNTGLDRTFQPGRGIDGRGALAKSDTCAISLGAIPRLCWALSARKQGEFFVHRSVTNRGGGAPGGKAGANLRWFSLGNSIFDGPSLPTI